MKVGAKMLSTIHMRRNFIKSAWLDFAWFSAFACNTRGSIDQVVE
jgi:hypothetical protein